jgi:thioredoxin-dependent peroxiredoxin
VTDNGNILQRPGMKVGDVEHRVQGEMLEVDSQAPDFELIAPDYSKRTMADYLGKVKIISCVPSVDTRVCSAQTRRFNEEAASLSDDIVILTVSADLPSALRRYCATEGIENSETLSDHKTMKFSDAYGVHDIDARACQRAVFVVDQQNIVRYTEYVPVIGQEVNFDAALEAARGLVQT